MRLKHRRCSEVIHHLLKEPIRTEKDQLDLDYGPLSVYLRGVGGLYAEKSENKGMEVLLIDLLRTLEQELRAAIPANKARQTPGLLGRLAQMVS